MQTLLLLDIDPAVLAELLGALTAKGQVLAIQAGQDAPAMAPTGGLDLAAIRTLLTLHGLTARQCDIVLLDVQGHSRTDIAELCGISPATVKKYWATIYARLGIDRRQTLRGWLLAHYRSISMPVLTADLPHTRSDTPDRENAVNPRLVGSPLQSA
jgi:DNA-binding NarL/FixJ family response regulator